MNDVFAIWGCGNGLLKSLQPRVRIISGMLVGSACLLMPVQSTGGSVLMAIAAICWCSCAAMPVKMVVRCAVASLILFFPFLLVTPWMRVGADSASPIADRLAIAGGIALRSTCMLFIAASTMASLAMHDVHRGLGCLPIPRPFAALIMQLINQTSLLTAETMRIIGVLRLRGATGIRGVGVLFSFPVVWMVRMLFRAERTAAAMSVRGYGIEAVRTNDCLMPNMADVLAIICASAVLAVSILMRARIVA